MSSAGVLKKSCLQLVSPSGKKYVGVAKLMGERVQKGATEGSSGELAGKSVLHAECCCCQQFQL